MTQQHPRPVRPALQPVFVAHRGAASDFPENSLIAVHAACEAGIRHVEVDVQLSADRVPMLAHDATLLRTGGVDRVVSAALARELTGICVGERDRFGERFAGVCMPTLRTLIAQLQRYDALTLFVELKRDALRDFGRGRVLDAVLPVLAQSEHEIVLISFDAVVLQRARERTDYPIGWVLGSYDESAQREAAALAPQYLFCNVSRLPRAGPLWDGPWEWAVYEITDLADARALAARGVRFIESMAALALARAASEPA